MLISSLYHFPVKSLQGHSCHSLTLDQFGAVGDRRWMVVDSDNRFVTQRRLRTMAKLQATNIASGLLIENQHGEQITVSHPDSLWRSHVPERLLCACHD